MKQLGMSELGLRWHTEAETLRRRGAPQQAEALESRTCGASQCVHICTYAHQSLSQRGGRCNRLSGQYRSRDGCAPEHACDVPPAATAFCRYGSQAREMAP